MKDYFDVDKFSEYMFISKDKSIYENEIDTKDIANWLECSVRYIQKWAVNNNMESNTISGRKTYIWTEEKLEEFALYFNRNYNKPKKKYYYYVKKEKVKVKKVIKKKDKTLPFTTTKDIVNEIQKHLKKGYKDVTILKFIRKYCKVSNVEYEYHFGRKYYKITEDIKTKIIKLLLEN